MAQTDNTEFIRTSDVVEKLFHYLDYGILIVDSDLKVHYWSEWLSLHSGIKSEQILGKSLEEYFQNFNVKTLKRKIKTSLSINSPTFYNASSSHYLLEFKQKKVINSIYAPEYMQQDVTIIPYDREKNLVIIKIQDQSELIAKNRELVWLNASLEHEKKIIDANIIMMRLDIDKKVTDISQAYLSLFEFEKSELLYQDFDLLEQFSLTQEQNKYVQKMMLTQEKFELAYKKMTQLGKDVYVKANFIPELNEQQVFSGYLILYQDETAQLKFKRQQGILMQHSRHAAMGEMISMIAHQWRQPLSLINTIMAKMRFAFETDQVDTKKIEDAFDKIENTVNYLSETINDFRDYFKPDKKRSEINLIQSVQKSVEFVLPVMEQNAIEYIFKDMIEKDVYVLVYANELTQIIINIVKNAVDAIVMNECEERYIHILVGECKHFYSVSIEDSGGGIPKKIQDDIFKPYFSTKSKNGTGLGLYMVKMIVEDHMGGEVRVSSDEKGSTFTLNIPKIIR